MPQGQIIGRVAVKVLPDTNSFRRDAERELNKIEKQLAFKVHIELDFKDLQEQLRNVKDKLEDWRKKNDPLKIGVQVDMVPGQTTLISARLAYLTRPRTVPIIPVMSEGALGAVMSALAALSGGRVLKDLLVSFKDIALEFDRWAPKIGLITTLLGSLFAVTLAGISNIAALSVAIASIGAAFLALPGLIGGMAIGLGAAISALVQFKEVLPGVFSELSKINGMMRAEFWSAALEPIREMSDVLLPLWSDGFVKVGGAMGKLFGDIASGMGTTLAPLMESMFANLTDAINTFGEAAPAIANIFSILSNAGAQVMPQLAESFAGVLGNFSELLTKANEDGSLQQWIQDGFQAMIDLGSSLASIGGIFKAIGDAAAAAGGSSLGSLADVLNRIQAVVEAPGFQKALTAVFEAAHGVMSSIGDFAGSSIVDLFQSLGETFVKLAPALGLGLGVALGTIAEALSSPAFQGAIVELFRGLAQAIVALSPAVMPLVQAMVSLVPVIVSLLNVIAPLITAAIIPLSLAIGEIAVAVIPIIELLGGALLQIIMSLTPLFLTLVSAIVPLVSALFAGLAPVLPIIIGAFSELVQALIPLLPPLMELLLTIFVPLLPLIAELAGSLLPMVVSAFKTVFGAVLPLIKVLTEVAKVVIPIVVKILQFLIGVLTGGIGNALKIVTGLFDGAMTTLRGIFNIFVGIFTGDWKKAWDGVKGVFEGLVKSVKSIWDGAIEFLQRGPQMIKDAFGVAGDILKDIGGKIIGGLIDGLKGAFDSVKSTLGDLTSKLTDWKGPAEKDAVLLKPAGQLLIDGLIEGLESRYGAVKKSLQGLTDDIGGTNMGNLTGSIDGALNGSLGEGTPIKVLNYYAAPGASLGSEEELFGAAGRARMVGW